jgi:hypothetical protein
MSHWCLALLLHFKVLFKLYSLLLELSFIEFCSRKCYCSNSRQKSHREKEKCHKINIILKGEKEGEKGEY